MSIYPVRLSEWYPPGDFDHGIVKFLVSKGPCHYCGKKKMHWQTAWAHHSLPFGYGDIWCREKCMNNYFSKIRKTKGNYEEKSS